METKDKAIETMKKVDDFWGRHNLSTRFSILTFIIGYLAVLLAPFFGKEIKTEIVDIASYSLLVLSLIMVVGVNGVEKVMSGLTALKYGKKEDKEEDK